jgi:uncharacterized membrane protein
MMKSLTLLLSLCLIPVFASAHKEDMHTLTSTAKSLAVGAVKAAETAVVAAPGLVAGEVKVARNLDWWSVIKASASSHNHNKIVHFPVALGLAGVFFGLLAYKFQSLRSHSRWMLFLAGIGAILAVLSGLAAAENVEPAAQEVLKAHRGQGLITCGLIWLAWILSFVESARKWHWVLLLFLGVVICGTGLMGGALAHMQF